MKSSSSTNFSRQIFPSNLRTVQSPWRLKINSISIFFHHFEAINLIVIRNPVHPRCIFHITHCYTSSSLEKIIARLRIGMNSISGRSLHPIQPEIQSFLVAGYSDPISSYGRSIIINPVEWKRTCMYIFERNVGYVWGNSNTPGAPGTCCMYNHR